MWVLVIVQDVMPTFFRKLCEEVELWEFKANFYMAKPSKSNHTASLDNESSFESMSIPDSSARSAVFIIGKAHVNLVKKWVEEMIEEDAVDPNLILPEAAISELNVITSVSHSPKIPQDSEHRSPSSLFEPLSSHESLLSTCESLSPLDPEKSPTNSLPNSPSTGQDSSSILSSLILEFDPASQPSHSLLFSQEAQAPGDNYSYFDEVAINEGGILQDLQTPPTTLIHH
ncbi:hypothetical protein VKT23_015919 [Stygiomarasmius scandens]|uniref:Uncharacterized protein n=1 Tax=Marasmiellus scandens TaxID=2682957 RepID=A0ABR1J0T1_9AGAR